MDICYTSMDHTGVGLLERLWTRLRDHHQGLTAHFAEDIAGTTFRNKADRVLAKAAAGKVHILLAAPEPGGVPVGYCISVVDGESGEIDSLYVLEEYRGSGIGDALMKQSLDWLQAQGAVDLALSVLYGNEQVLSFYEKYGFRPRAYTLKLAERRQPDA